jgi:quercetin dioxygenase-like cupin family protein
MIRMERKRLGLVLCVLCASAVSLGFGVQPPKKPPEFKPTPAPKPQPDEAQVVCTRFRDVVFKKDKPELGDKSAESAIVREDPRTHACDVLVKLPPGFRLAPHWHSANVGHTIIRGTYAMSSGAPGAPETELGPGSFNYTPGGIVHDGRVVGSEPVLMFESFDRARDIRLVATDGPPASGIGEGMPERREQLLSVKASDIKWQPLLPGSEAQLAILHEDPGTHATQAMIRSPGELYIPRHWHACSEAHIVLEGSFIAERKGTKTTLDTGSYNWNPPKLAHHAWFAPGGATILVVTDGKWDANWIEDPASPADPSEKKE